MEKIEKALEDLWQAAETGPAASEGHTARLPKKLTVRYVVYKPWLVGVYSEYTTLNLGLRSYIHCICLTSHGSYDIFYSTRVDSVWPPGLFRSMSVI